MLWIERDWLNNQFGLIEWIESWNWIDFLINIYPHKTKKIDSFIVDIIEYTCIYIYILFICLLFLPLPAGLWLSPEPHQWLLLSQSISQSLSQQIWTRCAARSARMLWIERDWLNNQFGLIEWIESWNWIDFLINIYPHKTKKIDSFIVDIIEYTCIYIYILFICLLFLPLPAGLRLSPEPHQWLLLSQNISQRLSQQILTRCGARAARMLWIERNWLINRTGLVEWIDSWNWINFLINIYLHGVKI